MTLPDSIPDTPMTVGQADDLERLIDRHGIETVLSVVSMICAEKSHHIDHSWQDRSLARRWMDVANKLDAILPRAHGL